MTPKKLFNIFAKAEAVTWTLLISALIARAAGLDPALVGVAEVFMVQCSWVMR
jgi:hypothetical protein